MINRYKLVEPSNRGYLSKQGIRYHRHHIIPQFMFDNSIDHEREFKDSPENLVLIPERVHLFVHKVFARFYISPRSTGSVLLLKGNIVEARKQWRIAGAYASHQVQAQKGVSMWNKECQKKRAQKSIAKPDSLILRSIGGKKGGKVRNAGIAINKKDRYIFFYQGDAKFGIMNCETGGDVLEELKKYDPQTKITRVTALLKGQRQTAYGWSCVKITE